MLRIGDYVCIISSGNLHLSLVDEQYISRLNKATRTMLKELEKVMNGLT